MKSLLIVVAGAMCAGCAATPTRNDAKVAKKINPVYTQGARASSVDAARKQPCPKNDKGYRSARWRDSVAMANSCVEQKNFAMVDRVGRHLSQTEGESPWGPYYMSLAAESRGELDKAMWLAHLAIKKAPDTGLLHFQLGRLLWLSEEHSEAVKVFATAVAKDDALGPAHEFLGVLFLKEGSGTLAEQHLLKALKASPQNRVATLALGEIYVERKDFPKAVFYLERAVDLKPSELAPRVLLAEVLENELKQNDEALVNYRKIKRLHAEGRVRGSLPKDLDARIQRLEAVTSAAAVQREVSMAPAEREKVKK
jgi:tetratricopeptide (TPR) repeat protein